MSGTQPIPVDFGARYRDAMRRLRQQRPILAHLYAAAAIAEQGLNDALATLPDPREELCASAAENASPTLQQIEQIQAHEGARDIYAACVALVLDDILSNLHADFRRFGGAGDPGPQVAGYSVRSILKALGNNFRHYYEWRRTAARPSVDQIKSIKPIAAMLFDGTLGADFANHGYYCIMARFVLHNMTDAEYLGIEKLVRQSMDAMVDALGLATNALVLEARAESLP